MARDPCHRCLSPPNVLIGALALVRDLGRRRASGPRALHDPWLPASHDRAAGTQPLAVGFCRPSSLAIGTRQREVQDRALRRQRDPRAQLLDGAVDVVELQQRLPKRLSRRHVRRFGGDRLLCPRLCGRPIRSLQVLERDLQHRRHMRGRSAQFLFELVDRAIRLFVQEDNAERVVGVRQVGIPADQLLEPAVRRRSHAAVVVVGAAAGQQELLAARRIDLVWELRHSERGRPNASRIFGLSLPSP